jgi:hypothetical protein
MTMPSAVNSSKSVPKNRWSSDLSGKQRPICAANLERPAEVRFSPPLKDKRFWLQSCARANLSERNEIALAETTKKDAAKFG